MFWVILFCVNLYINLPESNRAESDWSWCTEKPVAGIVLKIQYLEIVSYDVDLVCSVYEITYAVSFSEPDGAPGGHVYALWTMAR